MMYRWRRGFPARGVKADDAGREIARLCTENGCAETGRLGTGTVVDAARSAASALHPLFDWNDRVAGDAHRQRQARALLRALIVVAVPPAMLPAPAEIAVPVMVHLRGEEGYRPLTEVTTDAELDQVFLADRVRDLEQWVNRHWFYGRLRPLLADVRVAIARFRDGSEAA